MANEQSYLSDINDLLAKRWPSNKTINIVFHGHSVPAGYRSAPYVDSFHSYPYLVHRAVKEKFPFAVVNAIVTAIGGENSRQGCERFNKDVLCHRPDLLLIDYGLNDRQITLQEAKKAWEEMIEVALKENIKIILLTPSWDSSYYDKNYKWYELVQHTEQIRELAEHYQIGLSDTFKEFQKYLDHGNEMADLLSSTNHPTNLGHEIIAKNISRFFIAR